MAATAGSVDFRLDAWANNWFAAYLDEELLVGDAVSNADWRCLAINETPFNTTCDRESNPSAVAEPCEFREIGEPKGWKVADDDASAWTAATVHAVKEVGPKDGYDQLAWDANAELIRGSDLGTDNTRLCRMTVLAP